MNEQLDDELVLDKEYPCAFMLPLDERTVALIESHPDFDADDMDIEKPVPLNRREVELFETLMEVLDHFGVLGRTSEERDKLFYWWHPDAPEYEGMSKELGCKIRSIRSEYNFASSAGLTDWGHPQFADMREEADRLNDLKEQFIKTVVDLMAPFGEAVGIEKVKKLNQHFGVTFLREVPEAHHQQYLLKVHEMLEAS